MRPVFFARPEMRKIFLLIAALGFWVAQASAQTATVTASVPTYDAAGGQVTFTVALSYPANVSAVGFTAKPSAAAWTYVSTGGTNLPSITPTAPETTDPASPASEFGWTFGEASAIPANSASFNFVLSYPTGLTGSQVFTFSGHVRIGGVLTPITIPSITLTPTPAAPSISTQPASQTVSVGAAASFTVVATGFPVPTYKWQRSIDNGTTFTDLTESSPFSGVTSATLSISATTAAMNGHKFRVIATNGVASDATSTAATLTVNFAPTIITQPRSQAVSQGNSIVLTVVASGSPAPTYQWKKGASNVTDGGRISGATTATLTISNAQAGDDGGYSVIVSNAIAPTATSNTATITLAAAGYSATHALQGSGYIPGSTVTVTNTINYPGELSSLVYSVLLPTGWSYESGTNAGSPSTSPQVGDISMLEWVYATPPASGSSFTYTLRVPGNASGNQVLAALVEFGVGSSPIQIVATPDPLAVNQTFYHSADTNQNFKIDATELSRLIVLFNTRFDTGSGKVRTGSYKLQAGTVDGFASDVTRDPSATVALTAYHAADTNRNGKIDATELSRVIVLFNTRYDTGSGKVRTGAYKIQSGTVDGYAPEPTRAP